MNPFIDPEEYDDWESLGLKDPRPIAQVPQDPTANIPNFSSLDYGQNLDSLPALPDAPPMPAPVAKRAIATEPQQSVSDIVKQAIAGRAGLPYGARPEDVKEGQRLSNLMRFQANIGETGSNLAYGIAGVKNPNPNAYADLQKQANIPSEIAADDRKQALENDIRDPNSVQSRVYKNVLLKTVGNQLTPEDIRDVSAADAPILDKLITAQSNVDLKKAISQANLASRSNSMSFRDEQLDKRNDNKVYRDLVNGLKQDTELKKNLNSYRSLTGALNIIAKADKVTPQQIREFQQTVRGTLGIKGAGGVTERESTYLDSLGLRSESFMQFLTGDPAEIAKDNEILKHLKNLAQVELQTINDQKDARLGVLIGGYEEVLARHPTWKKQLEDLAVRVGGQFKAPSAEGWSDQKQARLEELRKKAGER